MPLAATPNNMAHLANNLMGQPYGWGGAEGYRDCSALIKDLFMPFGIWMPRNSGAQAKAGSQVSLKDFKSKEKKKIIVGQGIPFFSLITAPGHIVLYIGTSKEQPYIYHSVWGLRTSKTKRVIIGRSAIMPLDFGKNYYKVQTILDRSTGLISLHNRLTNPDEPLELLSAKHKNPSN